MQSADCEGNQTSSFIQHNSAPIVMHQVFAANRLIMYPGAVMEGSGPVETRSWREQGAKREPAKPDYFWLIDVSHSPWTASRRASFREGFPRCSQLGLGLRALRLKDKHLGQGL